MQVRHHSQTVAALIRHEGDILLVEQQGPTDPAPTWALPGGRTEAMIREVREETGLVVTDPGRLLYIRVGVHRTTGESSSTLVFEPTHWHGELAPDDPVHQSRGHDARRRGWRGRAVRGATAPLSQHLCRSRPDQHRVWRMQAHPRTATTF